MLQSLANLAAVFAQPAAFAFPATLAQADAGHQTPAVAHAAAAVLSVSEHFSWPVALIPIFPIVGVLLATVLAIFGNKSKLPAFLTVGCLAASFACAVKMYLDCTGGLGGTPSAPYTVHLFEWINYAWGGAPGQRFVADFSFYVDTLTCLWMLFVTGLGTLIALYASEYMSHDVGTGYCRFFAAFNLFVFSMACLVMGDNMILLFLGWEGVGLCSYLLIGYFYKRPSAVAAAKKAFIVNRIGDIGLSLGVMLTFVHFGSVEYSVIFAKAQPYLEAARQGDWLAIPASVSVIPLLLMVGAFGKSAQLPLYVWLPDAMEGPTPVSALIHAATMVTAGVYLVARMLPLFVLNEHALPIVAWVGSLTALFSATIGMAQFDIKRIMAYSTVSQLGYMFAGLGVTTAASLTAESAAAGPYHVFTHAFFKALLFLSCGAVMHGFGGQLDLRKLSGVAWMPGWKIVGFGMLVGCLNLSGFPFTAGFFSKDSILASAFSNPHLEIIGWILLVTAGLTAYYTFRVFFRVFVGPQQFEPGDEAHGHDDHGHDSHSHDAHAAAPAAHGHPRAGKADNADKAAHADFHPHPPGIAINVVLATLAIASLVIGGAAIPYMNHWVEGMVAHGSTGLAITAHAAGEAHTAGGHDAKFFGYDVHKAMMVVSSVVGILGILVAFVLHKQGRTTAAKSKADELLPLLGPLPTWAQNKWYVDELYNFLICVPLWVASHIFHLIDKLLVDGLVNTIGWLPRGLGWSVRPSQSGVLNGYAVGMASGIAIIFVLAIFMLR